MLEAILPFIFALITASAVPAVPAVPAVTAAPPVKATPAVPAVKAVPAARSEFEGVDPNTLTCDPKGQVFLLLPHFSSCSKFYMCAHGEEIEFTCPAGDMVFDFVGQGCARKTDVKCVLRKRGEEDDIDDGSGEDWLMDEAYKTFDGSVKSITADNVVNSVRPLSIESPGKSPHLDTSLNCLRADSAARQVPYKGDCQRYWRCMNGVPQAKYCTDGLLFNEQTQQCDFEANVKCMVEMEDELKSEFILFKKN